ncbi:alanine--tRNA ligase [Cerasicoccus arenae]|uniref:Alanine--tRNA ligase n=2 Tax=Cerasicoccus arenae TaxID=424488 RepID=A0A8J3GEA9_9BACT|nr:alanine--tRNA ligase [Cerasicoccus arenae]
MNQFVPYFLGEQAAPWPRAADTQKCIRAGGKHNDLEDVGFDTYHHTFFEMLGNWSFNDYFKPEAIAWAWELLTTVWGLPKERLYATVYQPGEGDPADFDQEAYDHWKAIFEKEGLDPAIHIRSGNKKDNFWMMGDTGPCGPCSELHIDLTPAGDTKGELVNADSPYCIEIWNLVFIQFNAEPGGAFKPLKAKHVDTGMGFERVAGIIATTKNFTDYTQPPSNYNSDLFQDIFSHISNMSGRSYGATMPNNRDDLSGEELNDVIFRVLADHIRTLSFSIADGILPSNEGRNYTLRRILRRAVMFGKRIDLKPGFFTKLVDPLVDKMGGFFPELEEQRDVIRKVIASEEKAFDRTIDRGLQLLDKITYQSGGNISGEEAFELYSTYGFPFDLTQLIARERGLSIDEAGFQRCVKQHAETGRAGHVSTEISVVEEEKLHHTQFSGFNQDDLTGFNTELIGYFGGEETDFLITTQSPFYAEMGGQKGDKGTIVLSDGTMIEVLDTVKDNVGHHLHVVARDPALKGHVGEAVTMHVDVERRRAIQRHHSATHLLNWALRETLGDHVRQAGSLVATDHLRFDFDHFEAMTPAEIERVERMVNQQIIANGGVNWFEVPFQDKPEDVIATFGEKYGAVVRVVDIGGYSKELCGGTHVGATGELGLFKIKNESAIAAGRRRIEAVCGESAFEMATQNFAELHHMASKLSCKPAEIEDRLTKLLDHSKDLEKKLRAMEQKQAQSQGGDLLSTAVEKDGIKWLAGQVSAANPNDMRGLAVDLQKKLGPSVVVLGGVFGDKVTVLALATPEAITAGHKAGDIIRNLTAKLGGKGGGKPDFAMGGGSDAAALKGALAEVVT